MSKRYGTFMVLLVLIHLGSIVQSCGLFIRCGDPVTLELDVVGIALQPFGFQDGPYDQAEPINRESLGVWLDVELEDLALAVNSGFISSAHAFQCEEDEIIIKQVIDSVQVFRIWSDSTQDISKDFLGVVNYPDDVRSISEYLSMESRTGGTFQYVGEMNEDNAKVAFQVTLDNGAIHFDTISVRFH